MLERFFRLLWICIIACSFLGSMATAQTPPQDFRFTATVGGRGTWSQNRTITIDSSGYVTFELYSSETAPLVLAETSYTVSPADLQRLWRALQDNVFSTLNPSYADTTFADGPFALINVKANSTERQVFIRNIPQPNVQVILDSLNAITPPSLRLRYTPPALRNIIPKDPCDPDSSLLKRGGYGDVIDLTFKKLTTHDGTSTPAITANAEPIHPGTVVAYSYPLSDLVKRGRVKFRSKGEFFGDAVSLTVDNTQLEPPSSIDIKLYLEFWGPHATELAAQIVTTDIQAKWSGAKTSGGIPINMEVITKVRPDVTFPPGTPGYHQIEMVPANAVRSHVGGIGGPYGVNEGTTYGQWELDQPIGLYAHEAGHLLGLDDQYDDYVKAPDGSWTSTTANQLFSDDAAFGTYLHGRSPSSDVPTWVNFLHKQRLYSVPKVGHDNDLMARVNQPLLQSDIDRITANPGLLVKLRPGDILVSRSTDAQNILITRADEMFVRPGQRRTLNGLYGACIDFHKDIPSTSTLFDLAPGLETWNGFSASGDLTALVNYLDSTRFYCGNANEAQAAVWRITDNVAFGNTADDLLFRAGVNPGDKVFAFPRLSSSMPTDTVARLVVPDELFPATIQPRFVDGMIGVKASFKGSVSKPSIGGSSTSFTWIAGGPDDMSYVISANSDSASLTPDRTGIFDVGLRITVNDSAQGSRTFNSVQQSHVIVPDQFTETFEHPNLADRLPWKTFGNAPWKISSTSAQTGTFSAEAGTLVGNQLDTIFSALEIRVSVPQDTIIAFSVRTSTTFILDRFEWHVDGRPISFIHGYTDWTILEYPLEAGEHTLTWTSVQYTATPSRIWLDNVFFPGNSVVSSAEEHGGIPLEFQLFQNFPNPFNPVTTIRYGLPMNSYVTLNVINTLGQQVGQLINGEKAAGYHEIQFDGRNLASGVYFYTIRVRASDSASPRDTGRRAGELVETRKFILLR